MMDFQPEDPLLALLLRDHLRTMSSDKTRVPAVWRFLRKELQKETFYEYVLSEPTDHYRLCYLQVPITNRSRVRECVDEYLVDVKTDYQHWVRAQELEIYLSRKSREHQEKYCR